MGTVVTMPPRSSCPRHPGVEPEVGFGLAGGGYGAYTYCPTCGQILDKTQEEPDELRVTGVSRDGGNNRVLLLGLNAVPSDDDLRSLHEFLRSWKR